MTLIVMQDLAVKIIAVRLDARPIKTVAQLAVSVMKRYQRALTAKSRLIVQLAIIVTLSTAA